MEKDEKKIEIDVPEIEDAESLYYLTIQFILNLKHLLWDSEPNLKDEFDNSYNINHRTDA